MRDGITRFTRLHVDTSNRIWLNDIVEALNSLTLPRFDIVPPGAGDVFG